MATLNAAATLEQVTNFSTNYAGASLIILSGATTLATHTIPSWTPSNSGNDGIATASTIADATIANTGTADSATITSGAEVITLTVGAVGSGADLELSTLNYISGETSSVTSLVVTAPAA